MKIRIIALLMALACAVTLFGCEAEEDSSIRRRKSRKETTEEYAELEDTVGEALWEEQQEETEKSWGQVDEKVEQTEETTEPKTDTVVDYRIPGDYSTPAVELMDIPYETLSQMRWATPKTWADERWFFQAKSCDCTFTFVYEGEYKDPDAKPIILNIERQENKGQAYVTQDIQLGDIVAWLPGEVQELVGPMDGGLYASLVIDGYSVDLLFDGEMDAKDDGKMYFAQLRRED